MEGGGEMSLSSTRRPSSSLPSFLPSLPPCLQPYQHAPVVLGLLDEGNGTGHEGQDVFPPVVEDGDTLVHPAPVGDLKEIGAPALGVKAEDREEE